MEVGFQLPDALQAAFAAEVREKRGNLSYKVVTFGCQMNEHDSQRLMGWCDEFGWSQGEEAPDAIIFNTCCVREGAERRVHGQIAALAGWRKENPDRFLAVCGCMMQQDGAAEAFMKRHRHVDLVMGTHALDRFPELVARALREGSAMENGETNALAEGIPARGTGSPLAYVAIAYGCDNFCSYCIVPYVRGRERSRAADDIVREIEALVTDGAREVTLLGQNVNSYSGEGGFPGLLRRVRTLGLARVRFMTSHPKDLSPELIEVMAEGRGVCAQLHLPVQSGSDRILTVMNRGYTARHYIDLVAAARAAMPDLGLTTDIIVGFPGETEEDFHDTLALVRETRPDGAYTFLYSPRKGTPAHGMPGRVSREEMSRRNTVLRAELEDIGRDALSAHAGLTREVLVESASQKGDGVLFGRLERGFRACLRGEPERIGQTIRVHIEGIRHHTLLGTPK